jgi:hypothetical protein
MRLVSFHCLFVLVAACGLPSFAAAPGTAPADDVYVVPFSHLDLFWAGTREECLARGNAIITKAIRLADRSPQFPQALRQARVPFMVMTRMGPADKSLFYWRAPDGSRALVWNTLKGYGWGTFLSSKTQLDQQRLDRVRKELADVRATTDGPILMNWGTDLWAPPDDLVE